MIHDKELKRVGRHQRVRKTVIGTSLRPRVCVHRSLAHFYAQLVDDSSGKVLFGVSTRSKAIAEKRKGGGNADAAFQLGEVFAAAAKNKGIKKVCFDRGGYLYHGRVKAFADGARKGGMEF